MKNVLYCRTVVPANRALDGETPTQIMATEEVNCWAVWRTSCEGSDLVAYFGNREQALEHAMQCAMNDSEAKP